MKNLIKSIITVTVMSSLAYAMPSAKEKFTKADVDNNGVISSQEFYNDQARKMEQKVKEGRALRGAATAPQFESVDKNGDKKITLDEYTTFHKIRQEQMQSIRKNGRGDGRGNGDGMGARNGYNR